MINYLDQILEQSEERNSTVRSHMPTSRGLSTAYTGTLCRNMLHYDISQKLVIATQLHYTNFSSAVICGNQLTDYFAIQIGVKQGCILSPFLFIMAIDWLMKTTTKGSPRGIRWNLTSCLGDFDFSDDLCMLSSRHKDMQGKMNELQKNSEKIGLKIHPGKTKVMKARHKINQPIVLIGKDLNKTEHNTYLGSNVKANGDS